MVSGRRQRVEWAHDWTREHALGAALDSNDGCHRGHGQIQAGSRATFGNRRRPSSLMREHGHTAHLELTGLEPGTDYEVVMVVGGKELTESMEVSTQVLWDYRMDPPPFSFVTGSCAYINEPEYDRPGRPYGGGYEIFESMAAEDPDMMLWLGDNIYLREVDFQSYSGFCTGTVTCAKPLKWPTCSRRALSTPFGTTTTLGPTTAMEVGFMPIGRAMHSRRFGATPVTDCQRHRVAFQPPFDLWTWNSSCWTTAPIA